jgi:hypothetical protein
MGTMPNKIIKNLFSWSKQKLLSLKTVAETIYKVEIERENPNNFSILPLKTIKTKISCIHDRQRPTTCNRIQMYITTIVVQRTTAYST